MPHSGCAVIISNGNAGEKKMLMSKQHAGKKMNCMYGDQQATIELDSEGEGLFTVNQMSAAVWIFLEAVIE